MYSLDESNLPSVADSFLGRARSFASGVAWGLHLGLTGTPLPLSQKMIGASLTQFESGSKIGIAEGLFQRQRVGKQ